MTQALLNELLRTLKLTEAGAQALLRANGRGELHAGVAVDKLVADGFAVRPPGGRGRGWGGRPVLTAKGQEARRVLLAAAGA